MNRNSIVWVLECCLLSLDGIGKKDLLKFGATDQEAEMGLQLCSYLKNKEIVVELKNGY